MTTNPVPSDTDRLAEEVDAIRAVVAAEKKGQRAHWGTDDVQNLLAWGDSLQGELTMHRRNFAVAVGDAYNEHTKTQAAEIERLTTVAASLQGRLDTAEGQLRTAEKELTAAHHALDVEGWTVEHGDCLVDLYHESSAVPLLTEVRDLGAILAFIADSNEDTDAARTLGLGEGDSDA
jgi:hypothetical protein